MQKNCPQCSASFDITQQDLDFYEKVSPEFGGKKYSIPLPTLCPDCRTQRRLAFRNERNLYHRKCDLTGRQMISVYSPDKPYKVYEQSAWWSDQFDPLYYGREFDFSRPFFEQWQNLSLSVPRLSIHNAKSENSEYTNYSGENRNCYLVVGGLGAEDCYYSHRVFYSKNIIDCYDLYRCELCYECRECKNLYGSFYSSHCHDSSSLAYCSDCLGCSDCFGCIGLRQKRHHILNERCSPEEYQSKVQELLRDKSELHRKFEILRKSVPVRNLRIVNSEDCTGDNIVDSRQCQECFTIKNSDSLRYCAIGEGDKSCQDVNYCDNCELQWNSANLEKNYQTICANLVWYVNDSLYATSCFNSSHIFGCIGMKKHQYCIFNKRYSKEEYEELAGRIVKHMQNTGEWGQYFPPQHSPFGYNETVATEDYPLHRSEVIQHGWQWHEEEESQEQYLGPSFEPPQNIADVSEGITKQILTCEITKKPYKIIPQELKFYRRMGLPLPKKSPDQRHKERMALRNPRKLWRRTCDKCAKEIQTTYSSERPAVRGSDHSASSSWPRGEPSLRGSEDPSGSRMTGSRRETVYCESCYLASVY